MRSLLSLLIRNEHLKEALTHRFTYLLHDLYRYSSQIRPFPLSLQCILIICYQRKPQFWSDNPKVILGISAMRTFSWLTRVYQVQPQALLRNPIAPSVCTLSPLSFYVYKESHKSQPLHGTRERNIKTMWINTFDHSKDACLKGPFTVSVSVSVCGDANEWVQLTSMELFTLNDAKH